ncbi:MAG: 2-isopropylmalate synthase [Acidimicrobiia bacterium]|nr:2-isopropylmalate synthase [Acidimicrobiia bacterium]MDH4306216.1 2-isopropylmalate synthase [Acidimicrobiia bacterium]MDH5292579.1 2-isopropylmalate synthase [Acidimicrobiia bacterium]
MTDRLIIFDTTLRDGEQAPGIALTPDEKVAIAHQLGKLRVDVLEAGFAASSPGDFEAVSRIATEVRGPVIASLARAHPDDIDRAAEALAAAERFRIHVFMSTSQIHMEKMLRMTPEEVLKASVEGVKRARQYTNDVEFSPQDATRTDHDFLIEVCRAAVEAGATTINIPDTVGYATPSDFVELMQRAFREVKGDRDDVIMSVHCHNDLGLAVANSLSSIHAGARQIEGAINGIGERAGNTSIEEVIMAVRTRQDVFGVDVGADTTQLYETSRLVSRLTGYPVQYNKSVVGRNAFAHESGIHQHGVLRDRLTYEIMDAASVGQVAGQIILGKHSGRAGFADALDKLGIVLEEDAFARAFEKFKQLADRKVQIGEDELRAIVEEEAYHVSGDIVLLGLHVTGGNDVTPSATVVLNVAGATKSFTGEGDGMVHAAFAAIKEGFGIDARLVDYRVVPVTSGADAMAEVNVVVRVGGDTFAGRALHTDVVEGSAEAFVEALNKASS